MRFPGTITVPDKTFETTLEYAARSTKLHGFRDIVFLGDHGGYRKSVQLVADRLNREWEATPVRVHAVNEYYYAETDGFGQILRERGYRQDEIGSHAGLADTALLLDTNPEMVRSEGVHTGSPPGKAEGVEGDPRRATAALGQLGVDETISRTIEAIKKSCLQR
jgi:creatinine amidohydrolase/Fe(II)-dependent formamide hydrolase-like protein